MRKMPSSYHGRMMMRRFKIGFVVAMWVIYGVSWYCGIVTPGAGVIIIALASFLVLTD